jgi:hypothetical protein
MKKLITCLLAVLAVATFAAQKTTFTQKEVRDPRQLAVILASNAADAEARLAINGITNGIATMQGGATLDNTSSAAELNITETAVKLTANAAVTGTLGVTGVATFTAAPKLTSTTAEGSIALVITNGPAATNAGKADPIYLKVSVGTNSYVIPAWYLTP